MARRKRPAFCPLHEMKTYNCDWTCTKACTAFGYWSAALDKYWLTPVRNYRDKHNPLTRLPKRDRRGEHNPKARLHEVDISEIRQRKASGESGRQLAKVYGVRASTIYRVLRRDSWQHVA